MSFCWPCLAKRVAVRVTAAHSRKGDAIAARDAKTLRLWRNYKNDDEGRRQFGQTAAQGEAGR
jgi:hypothetical protein